MAISGNRSHEHQHRQCVAVAWAMNPDMALGSSLGLEVSMASGGKQACGPPLSPNLSHIYPPILRANCLGGYVCAHLCALYVLFLKPNS